MHFIRSCHPYPAVLFFLSVLLIILFCAHPLLHLLSLAGSMLFLLSAHRSLPPLRTCIGYLLLFGLITLTNPLFSHEGATPLLFIGNLPITLESLLYGADSGVMLISVILWFNCFQMIFTADKLLFLFGRFSPKTALLLTTALRFVPMLRRQIRKIRDTQQTMGLFSADGWTDRLKSALRVCTSLISWSLENAVDTGASMEARGYDLLEKTHYMHDSFHRTDACLLGTVLLLDTALLIAAANGALRFSFYPTLTPAPMDGMQIAALSLFTLLNLIPTLLEGKEALQWRCYRSRI